MKRNYYTVQKRSGEVVPFEIEKIRMVIDWAIKGLDNLNPLHLESKLELVFKKEMTSKEIHSKVIHTALNLTSLEEPEWSKVAARLKILSMYKDSSQNRDYLKFGYDNYLRFVTNAVKKGLYDKVILEKYSKEDLKRAAKILNPDYDLLFEYPAVNILDYRYLIKDDNNKIFELPQEAFLTIALLIEQNQPKKTRMKFVEDTYTKIAQRKISLATPILCNLRKPNGNLSSCFITAADDDLKSIYYVNDQVGKISQNGGGVGINISNIRSTGAYIQNVKGASGGVIPWSKIYNDTALAVNQLGKRAGAFTVALDIWHRDILDFLEIQTENGDQNKKAYSIFPQVVVLDEFMKRVENNDYWYMFDPHEFKKKFGVNFVELWGEDFSKKYNQYVSLIEKTLDEKGIPHKRSVSNEFEEKWNSVITDDNKKDLPELVTKIKARELIKHMMKTQIETGMPYISFKDTMNRYNPNIDNGLILCGNLCMESFSNTSPSKVGNDMITKDGKIERTFDPGDLHTCNLLSINLATLEDEEEESVSVTSVRILDNLIDLTDAPIIEGKMHNDKYRTIGVGFMGYADYTVKKGKNYVNSKDLASELFERMAYYCTKASMNLAKDRGSFETFETSELNKGIILGKNKTWFRKNSKMAKLWVELIDDIKKYGIRNSQITAIAPNTSTSLLQGCTPSVLPIFSKFYMDNSKTTNPITPPFIKEGMWLYQENKNINQRDLIEIVSHIQKWIDTGISMELILNPNLDYVDAEYFYNLIMDSWKKECKTIYYIRSVQKGEDLEKGDEACASCAG